MRRKSTEKILVYHKDQKKCYSNPQMIDISKNLIIFTFNKTHIKKITKNNNLKLHSFFITPSTNIYIYDNYIYLYFIKNEFFFKKNEYVFVSTTRRIIEFYNLNEKVNKHYEYVRHLNNSISKKSLLLEAKNLINKLSIFESKIKILKAEHLYFSMTIDEILKLKTSLIRKIKVLLRLQLFQKNR